MSIEKSLKRQALVAKVAKKFKATTNSKHSLPVADNLLEQNFNADRPNEKWVQDITCLWTTEGWLYLAVVIDLCSRQVVGWSMSERMTAPRVCDALKNTATLLNTLVRVSCSPAIDASVPDCKT